MPSKPSQYQSLLLRRLDTDPAFAEAAMRSLPLFEATWRAVSDLETANLEDVSEPLQRLYQGAHSSLVDLYRAAEKAQPASSGEHLLDMKPDILARVDAYCQAEFLPSRICAIESLLHIALLGVEAAREIPVKLSGDEASAIAASKAAAARGEFGDPPIILTDDEKHIRPELRRTMQTKPPWGGN